jgi:hypothetical protein
MKPALLVVDPLSAGVVMVTRYMLRDGRLDARAPATHYAR